MIQERTVEIICTVDYCIYIKRILLDWCRYNKGLNSVNHTYYFMSAKLILIYLIKGLFLSVTFLWLNGLLCINLIGYKWSLLHFIVRALSSRKDIC